MSKTAFREITKKKWEEDAANCWDKYRRLLSDADALEFEISREKVTAGSVDNLLDMVQAGWWALQPMRVVRYMEKQGLLHGGTQHLIDYRKIPRDTGTPEAKETLWPKDLMAAYEQLVQAWAACHQTEYHAGFAIPNAPGAPPYLTATREPLRRLGRVSGRPGAMEDRKRRGAEEVADSVYFGDSKNVSHSDTPEAPSGEFREISDEEAGKLPF